MRWLTWSPFQSETTRTICAHLSVLEKIFLVILSGLYGLWVAASISLPVLSLLMPVMTRIVPVTEVDTDFAGTFTSIYSPGIAVLAIVTHIAFLPIWQRFMRKVLASTAWARSQGIRSEDIALFNLPFRARART